LKGVKELQQQVLDGELTGWKREQQLAGNGLQMTQSLETIQVGGVSVLEAVLWIQRFRSAWIRIILLTWIRIRIK
jgi:hypothetical protein